VARERLDKLLVDRGLVASRERARALVMAGEVLVGGQPETKPGTQIDVGAPITLRAAEHPYVSRGALKLVKGLDAFGIDPAGAIALDIGASTGGFTDVLLRRRALRVYAIDVGYGQLAWELRQDSRVVVLERQNVRAMDLALVPEPCDLAVIDVSFISLTLVLPRVAELLRPPAGKPIVALVKPQFEVGREQVGKGGVVRDEAARRGAIDKVTDWARASGFEVGGDAVESPIRGPAGNVEYLLLLKTLFVATLVALLVAACGSHPRAPAKRQPSRFAPGQAHLVIDIAELPPQARTRERQQRITLTLTDGGGTAHVLHRRSVIGTCALTTSRGALDQPEADAALVAEVTCPTAIPEPITITVTSDVAALRVIAPEGEQTFATPERFDVVIGAP
jgi:23S rRNA (cytidine1920-2'-O)/16S rRNA (cytidine1409-2'-O)-methyltransferase